MTTNQPASGDRHAFFAWVKKETLGTGLDELQRFFLQQRKAPVPQVDKAHQLPSPEPLASRNV